MFQVCVLAYVVITGAAAFILLLTSLSYFRRKHFTCFISMHRVMFVLIVGFAILHKKFMAALFAIPLLLFFIDYILRQTSRKHTVRVLDARAMPGDLTRIEVSKDQARIKMYDAGQYMFLHVPQASSTEYHPISYVSPSPPSCIVYVQYHRIQLSCFMFMHQVTGVVRCIILHH